jgi:hypothetical protein
MRVFKSVVLFASLFFASIGLAQTSNLTGALTDSNGTAWANATWTAKIFNPFGGPLVYKTSGAPIPSNPSGTLNSSGVFTGTLPDNSQIVAQGTQWILTVCSHTSAPCVTIPSVIVTGASYNMGAYASAHVTAPSFPSGENAYGYSDAEVSPVVSGGIYYNVLSDVERYWSSVTNSWISIATGSSTLGSVQYNDPATNYIWYSASLFIVSTANTGTATALNCDGTTCVVTMPNNFTAGQPIQFAGTWSPSCLNYVVASVETTGLSNAQFEVSETNLLGVGTIGSTGCTGTQTGTGGVVQDASYFAPFASSKLPFFKGHGTTYDYGVSNATSTDMVNNYAAMVHPHTTAVTGKPSFVIMMVSSNDWVGGIGGNCFSTATTEANLQTLMIDAHTDDAQVIMMTSQAWPYNGIGCDGGVGFSRATQVNDWLRGQGKGSSSSGQPVGAYWDRLIDVASVLTNYSDANFRITVAGNQYHLNDGGNAYLAALTNAGMGVQGSSIQALVSSTCGPNNDIACLSEANTFGASQTVAFAGTPSIGINETASGGEAAMNVFNNGGTGVPYFTFNLQNSISFHAVSGGYAITLPNEVLGWNSGGGGASPVINPPDVGLSRDSAGVVDVGNGGVGDKSGTLKLANIFGPATAPTGTCIVNGNFQFSNDGAISVCLAGNWTTYVNNGTVNTGWSNIGNGLILEWGLTASFDTGPVTITLPHPLPTALLSVTMTDDYADCGTTAGRIWLVANLTATTFDTRNDGAGCAFWQAIGH